MDRPNLSGWWLIENNVSGMRSIVDVLPEGPNPQEYPPKSYRCVGSSINWSIDSTPCKWVLHLSLDDKPNLPESEQSSPHDTFVATQAYLAIVSPTEADDKLTELRCDLDRLIQFIGLPEVLRRVRQA